MTSKEAIKTLKENYCAMCAYGSQDMDSCDIRSCDNKDAIQALEQEPCDDIKEIREVMSCDTDAETKCKMISNILTAKPHYFKEQETCSDAISRQREKNISKGFEDFMIKSLRKQAESEVQNDSV